MALDHHDARRARDASKPSAPVPANRSRQRRPSRSWPSQLNSVSRTRSGVGRRPSRSSTASGVRFQSPPMMRIVCGLPRQKAAGRQEQDIRNIDDGGTGRARGAPLNRRTLPGGDARWRERHAALIKCTVSAAVRPRERRTAPPVPALAAARPLPDVRPCSASSNDSRKRRRLIRRNRNRPTRSKRTNRPKRPRSRPARGRRAASARATGRAGRRDDGHADQRRPRRSRRDGRNRPAAAAGRHREEIVARAPENETAKTKPSITGVFVNTKIDEDLYEGSKPRC